MLLYLTSNPNIGIFDFLSDEQGMIIKKFTGSFHLKQFVLQDMRSLTHYAYFAIDYSALKDSIEDLTEALMAFRSMYTSRIIIYMDSIEDREAIVRRLIDLEIYNIVYDDDIEQAKIMIKKACGSLGMNKKDALQLISVAVEGKEIPYHEYHFSSHEVKIGITGASHKVGTTTMAMNLCHVLASMDAKVCYVEANNNRHMRTIFKEHRREIPDKVPIIYNGICFMDLTAECDEAFDFIIYDMGFIEPKIINAIRNKCTVGILCATGKPYEMYEYEKSLELLSDVPVNKVFSFIDDNHKSKLTTDYGKIHFSEYVPDLFDAHKNQEMWLNILSDYIKKQ